MRREGRMHGWVYAYELLDSALDPTYPGAGVGGKRRVVHEIKEQTATGGFVRVSRKPTNHSKYTGRDPYEAYSKRKSCKGRNKLRHDKAKMYYLHMEMLDDDYYYEDHYDDISTFYFY